MGYIRMLNTEQTVKGVAGGGDLRQKECLSVLRRRNVKRQGTKSLKRDEEGKSGWGEKAICMTVAADK